MFDTAYLSFNKAGSQCLVRFHRRHETLQARSADGLQPLREMLHAQKEASESAPHRRQQYENILHVQTPFLSLDVEY